MEAKKQGATMIGFAIQSDRYTQGLPAWLPDWRRPLPFVYESTAVETQVTSGLDPQPRAPDVLALQRAEILAEWLKSIPAATARNTAFGAATSAESPQPPCAPRRRACRR